MYVSREEVMPMYVSERVVNIKELEDYISGAFAMVLCAVEKLQKAHTFEFCVERRKTI